MFNNAVAATLKLFTKWFAERHAAVLLYIYFPDWLEASIVSGPKALALGAERAKGGLAPAGQKSLTSVSLALTSYVHSASSTASAG
jgi:hypothetical protein